MTENQKTYVLIGVIFLAGFFAYDNLTLKQKLNDWAAMAAASCPKPELEVLDPPSTRG